MLSLVLHFVEDLLELVEFLGLLPVEVVFDGRLGLLVVPSVLHLPVGMGGGGGTEAVEAGAFLVGPLEVGQSCLRSGEVALVGVGESLLDHALEHDLRGQLVLPPVYFGGFVLLLRKLLLVEQTRV